MKLTGIKARRTTARRLKVEVVWEALKERDLSFSYKDFLVVYQEMFGKAGQPTRQQLKSDIRSLGVRVWTTQAPVAGTDFRTSLSWLGAVTETIYYHRPFESIDTTSLMEEE
uniref:Uncharacterized protein n=1 Tax=viral metagenome TaxID=1070528 RepID=A0A2V0RJX2_9ZZZZ